MLEEILQGIKNFYGFAVTPQGEVSVNATIIATTGVGIVCLGALTYMAGKRAYQKLKESYIKKQQTL